MSVKSYISRLFVMDQLDTTNLGPSSSIRPVPSAAIGSGSDAFFVRFCKLK
jgi:hypothetical protein